MKQETKIFFYGGSFNPPHIAHVLAATYLVTVFPEAEILIAPILRHAFDKELLSFEKRFELLKLAFQDFPKIKVSRIEFELNLPKSRTIDCIHALKKQNPDAKIYTVIGSDLVKDLPQWKDFEALSALTEFFVFPRPGYAFDSPHQTPMLADVSSSELRDYLAQANYEKCKALMPKRVLDNIIENKLYCKL